MDQLRGMYGFVSCLPSNQVQRLPFRLRYQCHYCRYYQRRIRVSLDRRLCRGVVSDVPTVAEEEVVVELLVGILTVTGF
ncbi:hypothetical protein Glove_564g39 [Diversispora epigaea]|uniref:Uncharacterized protein n=1 Tax=Diversispora epigaea TaxID=1348612 RepID=A0A397GAA1_9GLOM|nr:hypothetical protein Glove_564g39 [Diversispora epigaea]